MKICIDAGHGPDTPGKRSPDGLLREYQFNSATARYVIELLKQYDDVEILTTFEDSRDVPLLERTNKANAWKADVLVSIHANASGSTWSNARGIETFVYTTSPYPHNDVALATTVQKHLINETGLRDRGVKTANLHMLRESKMTSILVECGFMTNREEVELLKSDDYRRKCARAIVAGIVEMYSLKKKGVELKMSPEDAQKVVDILGAVFNLFGAVRTEKISIAQDEIHRLADEVRKAGGLK